MVGRMLPLASDESIARVEGAGPGTPDDTSITVDGRRLDTKEAVAAWLPPAYLSAGHLPTGFGPVPPP